MPTELVPVVGRLPDGRSRGSDGASAPRGDVSAIEIAYSAQRDIAAHVIECRARQLAILSRFDESSLQRDAFRGEMRESVAALYSIMWKAAFGLIATLTGIIVALSLRLGHVA